VDNLTQVTILVDRRPTNVRVGEKGEWYSPEVVLCVERASGMILSCELRKPEDDDLVAETAGKAVEAVRAQFPQAQIIFAVRQDHVAGAIIAAFPENPRIARDVGFDSWDEAYLALDERMGAGGAALPYLWRGDISAEEVAEFFRVAAKVYKARPWRRLGDLDALMFPDLGPAKGKLVVAVMGSEGLARGIAVFPSRQHYDDVITGDRPPTATFVSFEKPSRVPPIIQAEAERHGWTLANKSAFPLLVRVRAGEPVMACGDDVRRAMRAFLVVAVTTDLAEGMASASRAEKESPPTPAKRTRPRRRQPPRASDRS